MLSIRPWAGTKENTRRLAHRTSRKLGFERPPCSGIIVNIKIIGSTLCGIFLVACGSAKDPSNANFEKAINAHFAKDCVSIQPTVFGADGRSYPMTVALQQKNTFTTQAQTDQNNARTTQAVDMLTKAGLLTVNDGSKQVKPMFGNVEITVPTKVYTLTDMGKKALVSADSTAMCVGHFKVDEVIRFTEPSSTMGHTISEVSFTASPVDVPDWAKSAEIQKTFGLDRKLAVHTKSTRTVVLASDGWIDANDFSR